MKLESTLWVAKYRPKKIEEVVLPEIYGDELRSYIKNNEIPNLLFSGPAGGGKTTLARIIVSKEGVLQHPRSNLLAINGSSQEARSINFVTQVIEPFLKIPPAGNDKYKIVFIDEVDNLTLDSFKSLRGIIEKFSEKYGRFIGTCNYISKIPDPIQSRFTPYVFKQIPMDFIEGYCSKILKIEEVKYTDEDLRFIIENLYPDVRKMINAFQRMSATGTLKVNRDIALTNERALIGSVIEIMNCIKNKNPHKISKLITTIIAILDKQDLEYSKAYLDLFNNKLVPVPARIIVNQYSNSHQSCLVPSMHFAAMIFAMIQAVDSYYKAIEKK